MIKVLIKPTANIILKSEYSIIGNVPFNIRNR